MCRQIIKSIFTRMTIIVAIALASSMTLAQSTNQEVNVPTNETDFIGLNNEAALGDKSAQFILGRLYQDGSVGKDFVVARDYVQAQKWYILSSWQDHESARVNRDKLARRLSLFQILAANIQAKNVLLKNLQDAIAQDAIAQENNLP